MSYEQHYGTLRTDCQTQNVPQAKKKIGTVRTAPVQAESEGLEGADHHADNADGLMLQVAER